MGRDRRRFQDGSFVFKFPMRFLGRRNYWRLNLFVLLTGT